MSTPFISVIMPVFRAENFLKTGVNCILNQTFSDFELILVDDKSPDNSAAICDDFAKKDNRIKVIHLAENGGAGNARNIGIKQACGKYVIFIDCDDTVDNNLLELLVNSLNKNPAKVVIYGLLEEYINDDGSIRATRINAYPEKFFSTAKDIRNEIVELERTELYGYAANKLIELEHLRTNNILFPAVPFNEDILFNIEVFMELDSCNIINAAPYHYAKRANSSVTSRFIPTYYTYSMMRLDKLYDQFVEWDMLGAKELDLLASRYSRYFFSALERNLDKRMNMTPKQRKQFFDDELKTERFAKLSPYMSGGGLSGIMAKAFKSKKRFLCLAIARIINFIKTNIPTLFEKIN